MASRYIVERDHSARSRWMVIDTDEDGYSVVALHKTQRAARQDAELRNARLEAARCTPTTEARDATK